MKIKKIVIAPDSFKGTLKASEVCDIIADIANDFFPDIIIEKVPLSDGGEGLIDCLLNSKKGTREKVKVMDPLGREVDASYAILESGTVVVEMAEASGLPLLEDDERNVVETTTYGTGQLIKHALCAGYRKFILGLGGSATNDGGAGAAHALGICYVSKSGHIITSGKDLVNLTCIDTSGMMEELKEAHFIIASDVKNPLYGLNGAAFTFSPQKGASLEQVALLDKGLKRLAEVILESRKLDIQTIEGSGAAGGLAVPFITFLDTEIKSGIDLVLDEINFDSTIKDASFVITGEGQTDYQTSLGKVLDGVGKRAKKLGVPVLAISGSVGEGFRNVYANNISAIFSSIQSISSKEEALLNAEENLINICENIFRLLRMLHG